MLRNSIVAAAVFAFAATSTVACAAPTDTTADAETVASTASASTLANPVVLMGEALLEELAGESLAEALFPAPSVDYARLNADFATAAKQGNMNQTVDEQGATIDGMIANLNDWELGQKYGESAADTATKIDARANWTTLNQSLGILSSDDLKLQGLPMYILGAQTKLSMYGKLVTLQPAQAEVNKKLLAANAGQFAKYVVSVKDGIQSGALSTRMNQFSACQINHNVFGNFRDVSFTDGANNNGYPDVASCDAARGQQMTAASNAVVASLENIAWMDDVVRTWTEIAKVPAIHVVNATYGANVANAQSDVTAQVAFAAEHQASYTYTVDYKLLGDRAPNVNKDFRIDYTCSKDGPTKTVAITNQGESNGQSMELTCP